MSTLALKSRATRWARPLLFSLTALAAAAQCHAQLSDDAVRARVDALMARMTLEEKAGQITQHFVFQDVPNEEARAAKEVAAARGGSVLLLKTAADINRFQKMALQTRLGIPLLVGFDVIHGFHTVMPVPLALAASWDPSVAQEAQAVAAREARAVGIHWTFAPNVDIGRDARWGRTVEGAGEDPTLGSAMAVAQVKGFQGAFIGAPGHVIAGPKHFAGYGASLGGRDYDEVDLSDSQLWNVYLKPFKAAVDAGAGNIMSAYMGLNGVPASGNHWLLTEVLRKSWGFKGFVVTDAGAAFDLTTHGYTRDRAEAGKQALMAGVDMEMTKPFDSQVFGHLPDLVAKGEVPVARLDEAVRRVLEAKVRMGVFEKPLVDEAEAAKVLADPAHRDVARRAAERSFVLLRNDKQLLPLKGSSLKSVAVIGPLADAARDTAGPWIFAQNDAETVTVLAGLKAKLGAKVKLSYSPGVSMPKRANKSIFPEPLPVTVDDGKEIARAVQLAKQSDVAVLVLGEAQIMSGENASRSSFDLPGRQQELLAAVMATGKPVVALLMSARPLDLKGVQPQALMQIWYPGTQGGAAVANVLTGEVSPGGKLPFTWPRNIGQVPLNYAQLQSHFTHAITERYWNEPNTPLYPFGFGLSYSSFAIENLALSQPVLKAGETLKLSATLRNTGARKADEVVQLYVRQKAGSAARPVRELKAFSRVTLDAGASQTVQFELPASELQYWSAAVRRFVLETGDFDVFIGNDATAKLQGKFQLQADAIARP
ncbi:beta-glucosidase BglX [Roseateles paludis]|uniref:beta-glucosidase n=1 Tax=Roseateles paludis TaxID=3145238 RepID=A0ABV0G2R9_9BURK